MARAAVGIQIETTNMPAAMAKQISMPTRGQAELSELINFA
jgi:hypothetical protein